jgi:hypothetical protein
MVSQRVQARTWTSLVGFAWGFPSVCARGVDILGRGVEAWSRERQQSSPIVADTPGFLLREVLRDVWKGVGRACDCEADERGRPHLVDNSKVRNVKM